MGDDGNGFLHPSVYQISFAPGSFGKLWSLSHNKISQLDDSGADVLLPPWHRVDQKDLLLLQDLKGLVGR